MTCIPLGNVGYICTTRSNMNRTRVFGVENAKKITLSLEAELSTVMPLQGDMVTYTMYSLTINN